jgi:hypothetical protein
MISSGNTKMVKNILRLALLLNVILLLFTNAAVAGPGNYTGESLLTMKRLSPVERTQYYSFGNSDFCWYDDGWQGAGWYLCGDEWSNGFGWGGPYGWNGWGGGYLIHRHGSHGIGVWHRGEPNHLYGDEGRAAGVSSGLYPSRHESGAAALHDASAASHGLGPGGDSATPGFTANAPAFHGGGEGFHGGGGGAFSVGGHGGGGHR